MQTKTVTTFSKTERAFYRDMQGIVVKYWLDRAEYYINLRQPGQDDRARVILNKKIARYSKESALVAKMNLTAFAAYYDEKSAEKLATGKTTPVTALESVV